MFLLGLILIIVGIAVAALLAHPQAHVLGGLIVLIGVIVLIVALVDVRGVHDAALMPSTLLLGRWRRNRLRRRVIADLEERQTPDARAKIASLGLPPMPEHPELLAALRAERD